jgi:hypothetical protein
MLISSSRIRSQKFVVIGGVSAPNYAITSADNVNEGQTITFNVFASNVPNGTVLYWNLSGMTASADFLNDVSSGTTTISSGSSTINVTVKSDQLTEGTETFILNLRTNDFSGPIVAQSNMVFIGDTSLTRTYSIVASSESFNEGGTAFFEIFTNNVPDGTTLYWGVLNETDPQYYSQTADFGSTSGTVDITGNYGTISIDLVADSLTEGIQKFYVSLRTGSSSGPIVASSSLITINDTSVAATPTYSVVASANPVSEGVSVTFNVTTTSVADGTTLYWQNTGTSGASDVTSGQTSGSFIINSNAGSVTLTLTADQTTEGTETIVFNVRTSVGGTAVAQTSVNITDTSVTPPPGCCISFGSVGGGGGSGQTLCSSPTSNLGGAGGGGGYVDQICNVTFALNCWYPFKTGQGGLYGYQNPGGPVFQATNGTSSCLIVAPAGQLTNNAYCAGGVNGGGLGGRGGGFAVPVGSQNTKTTGGGGGKTSAPAHCINGGALTVYRGGAGAVNPLGAGGGGGGGAGGPGSAGSGLNGGAGGPGYLSPIVNKIFGRGGQGQGATLRGGGAGAAAPSDPTLCCQWGSGGISLGSCNTPGGTSCGTAGAVFFKIPDVYNVAVCRPEFVLCQIFCGGDGFKCYVIGWNNYSGSCQLGSLCFYL